MASNRALQPPFGGLKTVPVDQPPYVGANGFGQLSPLGLIQPEFDAARVVNFGAGDKAVDSEEVADL